MVLWPTSMKMATTIPRAHLPRLWRRRLRPKPKPRAWTDYTCLSMLCVASVEGPFISGQTRFCGSTRDLTNGCARRARGRSRGPLLCRAFGVSFKAQATSSVCNNLRRANTKHIWMKSGSLPATTRPNPPFIRNAVIPRTSKITPYSRLSPTPSNCPRPQRSPRVSCLRFRHATCSTLRRWIFQHRAAPLCSPFLYGVKKALFPVSAKHCPTGLARGSFKWSKTKA